MPSAKTLVIDTNVPIVANGRGAYDPRCILACTNELSGLVNSGKLVLDDRGEIFDEYRKHLSPAGQPGLGDAFMQWVFEHQYNLERCVRVEIHPHDDRGYVEFPRAKALVAFDRSDRKFVATALASKLSPPICNAVDSDWQIFSAPLKKAGVSLRFLCP